MTTAVIALGANLDDRRAAVLGAIEALAATDGVTVVGVSSLYETDPVGGPEQPVYLNAVVVVETTHTAEQLLELARELEQRWQRVRDVRWGPRTLDVDIVDVAGVTSDDPVLTLPHPRAAERAFVLVPWREASPDAHLTGVGPIADIVVDETGVRMVEHIEVPR